MAAYGPPERAPCDCLMGWQIKGLLAEVLEGRPSPLVSGEITEAAAAKAREWGVYIEDAAFWSRAIGAFLSDEEERRRRVGMTRGFLEWARVCGIWRGNREARGLLIWQAYVARKSAKLGREDDQSTHENEDEEGAQSTVTRFSLKIPQE